MTLEEARDYLTRSRAAGVPAAVLYRPACGHIEEGEITRVSGDWVFVRYGSAVASQATDPADLELLAGKVPGDEAADRVAEARRQSDDEAWGGRGPSASHAEWVAEGQEDGDG